MNEPRSVKKTITGLAAAHMITDIYMPVLPAILPLLIAQNGYSYLAAGLLVTAYNVTSSFTQPVIGWLSDTRGLTISVSISLFISAVFVALMGIARDYYLIMAFAILAALGHACFHPTALSIVSRLCTSENRGRSPGTLLSGVTSGMPSARSWPAYSSGGSGCPGSSSLSSRPSSWSLSSGSFCRAGLRQQKKLMQSRKRKRRMYRPNGRSLS